MTDDEITRLFAEHDDVGAGSSIWLRLITKLLSQGKPPGEATVVCLDCPGQGKLPFGAFALTERDRLIFWPILPRDIPVGCRGQDITVPHHVTLEFPSGRIHATAYNERGTAVHRPCGRLQQLGGGFALWMMFVVELSTLGDQDKAVQRKAQTPVTDKARRESEFLRFAKKLSIRSMPLPASESAPRCVCCAMYTVAEGTNASEFAPSLFPNGGLWDGQIVDWPDGHCFMITRFLLNVGTKRVLLAACCPPGKPKSKVCLGFPNAAGLL